MAEIIDFETREVTQQKPDLKLEALKARLEFIRRRHKKDEAKYRKWEKRIEKEISGQSTRRD
jgi:hypothetical protein